MPPLSSLLMVKSDELLCPPNVKRKPAAASLTSPCTPSLAIEVMDGIKKLIEKRNLLRLSSTSELKEQVPKKSPSRLHLKLNELLSPSSPTVPCPATPRIATNVSDLRDPFLPDTSPFRIKKPVIRMPTPGQEFGDSSPREQPGTPSPDSPSFPGDNGSPLARVTGQNQHRRLKETPANLILKEYGLGITGITPPQSRLPTPIDHAFLDTSPIISQRSQQSPRSPVVRRSSNLNLPSKHQCSDRSQSLSHNLKIGGKMSSSTLKRREPPAISSDRTDAYQNLPDHEEKRSSWNSRSFSLTQLSRRKSSVGSKTNVDACVNDTNFNSGKSSESFPNFDERPSPLKVTEEFAMNIKATVSKAKLRAWENIRRNAAGEELANWRKSASYYDDELESDSQRNSVIVDVTLDHDDLEEDGSYEIKSRYANPHQRLPPELVPAIMRIKDGEHKIFITKEDAQYRKTINARRIAKLKEVLFDLVLTTEDGKHAADKLAIDEWMSRRPTLDRTDLIFQEAGININPDPTFSELVQFKTPARNDMYVHAELEPASKANPFASLIVGNLRPQTHDSKLTFTHSDRNKKTLHLIHPAYQTDLEASDTNPIFVNTAAKGSRNVTPTVFSESDIIAAFNGPSQYIPLRHEVHDILQTWLKDLHQYFNSIDEDVSAADIARGVFQEVEDWIREVRQVNGTQSILDREVVPEACNAGATPVDICHFVLAYLTVWVERCEENGW